MLIKLGETMLHEPHLDSLLMPCFSHCLQKYSVYHSLFTMCVFIFSTGPSGKGGSQVTVNINHPSHSIIDNVMLYIASHFNVCTYMDVSFQPRFQQLIREQQQVSIFDTYSIKTEIKTNQLNCK